MLRYYAVLYLLWKYRFLAEYGIDIYSYSKAVISWLAQTSVKGEDAKEGDIRETNIDCYDDWEIIDTK